MATEKIRFRNVNGISRPGNSGLRKSKSALQRFEKVVRCGEISI